MRELWKWAIAAALLGLSVLAGLCGDLGPQPGIGGGNAWNRNDYTYDSIIRVYDRDATLEVPALALWTNAVVELPRPSMTLTQVYYRVYNASWSSVNTSGKPTDAHILTHGYSDVQDYVGPMYAEHVPFMVGLTYRVKPSDHVDAFVALTNDWAQDKASGATSWNEFEGVTTKYSEVTAYDPVVRRYHTSVPCRLGVTDQSAHGLPFTFSGLRFLEGDETNGTFKLATGFNGYVHLRYNSESNTVTFTRLYEGRLPYNEN